MTFFSHLPYFSAYLTSSYFLIELTTGKNILRPIFKKPRKTQGLLGKTYSPSSDENNTFKKTKIFMTKPHIPSSDQNTLDILGENPKEWQQ